MKVSSPNLTMVPMSLGIAVGAGLAGGLLAPKFGRRVPHACVLVMALGVLGIWLTLELAGASVTTWQFVPALLVSGLGMGLLISAGLLAVTFLVAFLLPKRARD